MGIRIKQKDITDCGAACLVSISAYYKLYIPVARIRQYAGTDKLGTNVLGLIKASEKLGFEAKGVKGEYEALKTIEYPVIAHVILENQLAHYVVIYNVSKKVKIMDPADGQIHYKTKEEFSKIWTGVLVLIEPSKDFLKAKLTESNIKRFTQLLKPHYKILFQALIGAFLYTILGLSTAIFLQKITDHVLVDGNTNLLNIMGLSMLVLLAIQIIISVLKNLIMLKTGQQIDANLILGYYKHLLNLPLSFFDSMRTGEIISRINDAVKIRIFINDTLIGMMVNICIVIFSFSLMFIYNWKLAIIVSLIIPLYVSIYFIIRTLNKKVERRLMERAAELESQLVESITTMRTIKQFNIEEHTNVKTQTHFYKLLETIYKSGTNSIFSSSSSEILNKSLVILILWLGSFAVLNRELSTGQLLSFYALIGYFTGPAASLINMNKVIQNAFIASDRLFEIFELEAEENKALNHELELKGDIKFNQVCFGYGTRKEVFNKLNLTIPEGKFTAIVGESGSGKSTIAALIQKLYPLTDGEIRIGNLNLQHVTNLNIRNKISVVPQHIELYAATVLENIALGDIDPDLSRVLSICEQLGILSFIESLPNGFETKISENGVSLSGGERQRLAIARALYRDPEILILDEPTASLDSQSESYVQNTLSELTSSDKTIILIAHRLSSVIKADKIVVLKNAEFLITIYKMSLEQ